MTKHSKSSSGRNGRRSRSRSPPSEFSHPRDLDSYDSTSYMPTDTSNVQHVGGGVPDVHTMTPARMRRNDAQITREMNELYEDARNAGEREFQRRLARIRAGEEVDDRYGSTTHLTDYANPPYTGQTGESSHSNTYNHSNGASHHSSQDSAGLRDGQRSHSSSATGHRSHYNSRHGSHRGPGHYQSHHNSHHGAHASRGHGSESYTRGPRSDTASGSGSGSSSRSGGTRGPKTHKDDGNSRR